MLNIFYRIYLWIEIYLSMEKIQALMISSDECYNECVQKLSGYSEEEAILLWAAGKGFPKEVTLELGLTMNGFGRNSKQKELTEKYIQFFFLTFTLY